MKESAWIDRIKKDGLKKYSQELGYHYILLSSDFPELFTDIEKIGIGDYVQTTHEYLESLNRMYSGHVIQILDISHVQYDYPFLAIVKTDSGENHHINLRWLMKVLQPPSCRGGRA